ncbi:MULTISPECIES: hypothetical protein [Streptomyces]|uniref:hypothetical protein n=1 Tax=Streptomyces TaxID=1883 RepID=UPI000EB36E02|nr:MULTISPECIES: hypothetical protein [Streptomyces]
MLIVDPQLSYVAAVPRSQQVNSPRIDHLTTQAPREVWQRLSAGTGAKGERFCDWAAARPPAVDEFDGGEQARQRWMLSRRNISKLDETREITRPPGVVTHLYQHRAQREDGWLRSLSACTGPGHYCSA